MRDGRRFRGKAGGRAAGRRVAPGRRISSGERRNDGGEGGREGETVVGARRGCGVGGCCGRGMLWIGDIGVAVVVVVGSFSNPFPNPSSCIMASNFGVGLCFLLLLSAASCCFWSRWALARATVLRTSPAQVSSLTTLSLLLMLLAVADNRGGNIFACAVMVLMMLGSVDCGRALCVNEKIQSNE